MVNALPFSYKAPSAWNQLPVSVHHASSVSSFKSSLKTSLLTNLFISVVVLQTLAGHTTEQPPKKKFSNKKKMLVQFHDCTVYVGWVAVCV